MVQIKPLKPESNDSKSRDPASIQPTAPASTSGWIASDERVGQVSACSVTKINGAYVFKLTANSSIPDVVVFSLEHSDWSLTSATKVQINMTFSDGTSIITTGTSKSTLMQMSFDAKTLKLWLHEFTAAHQMSLRLKDTTSETIVVSLNGTTPAVTSMEECIKTNGIRNVPPPFMSTSPKSGAIISEAGAAGPAGRELPPIIQAKYGGNPVILKYEKLLVTLDIEPSHDAHLCEGVAPAACNVLGVEGAYDGKPIFAIPGRLVDDNLMNFGGATIALRRLDPSASLPQLTFTFYSGGAHCCTSTYIAAADTNMTWHVVDAGDQDGDIGFDFLDLNHDNTSELIGEDESFNYAYSSYAGSFPPTRILQLKGTDLNDASHDLIYRPFVIKELRKMEARAKISHEMESTDKNGYLAGWVAEKALVGQVSEAWRIMLASYDRGPSVNLQECYVKTQDRCPTGQEYVVPFPEALAIQLADNHYITLSQAGSLGYDTKQIIIKREQDTAAATADYELKKTSRWFSLTNSNDCIMAVNPASPADLISFDRSSGLVDNVNVMKSDSGGKTLIVQVGEPGQGNLITVYTFIRGKSECDSYRDLQARKVDDLK